MHTASDDQALRIRSLERELRFPHKDLHSFTVSAADRYIQELEEAVAFQALDPIETGQVSQW